MDDHDEQHHAFTNHPVILPPRFTAQVSGLPLKRKSGEGRILREKGQYIQVSPLGSLAGVNGLFVEYSLFVIKIHSFPYLRFAGLMIKYTHILFYIQDSAMRRLLLFALAILFMAGIAYGKSYEVKRKVSEYETQVKMDKYPPTLGDNHIEIEIKDGAGQSVTDAKVLVNYYMPPMPRMAPMNYRTDAKLKGEKYKATMNFIMSGPWVIAIKITRGEKTSTAKLNVDAQ